MKNKKGFKIFLFICVGLICVGSIFAGVGFALGGVPSVSYEPGMGFVPVQSLGNVFRGKTVIEAEDLEAFTDIKIYGGASNINFVESNKFAVEYGYDNKLGKPEISVVNNSFVYRDRLYDTHRNMDAIGFMKKTRTPMYVTVYYPAGTVFNSIYVDCNMGEFNINGLNADIMETSMDLGDVDFKRINVRRFELDADVGDVNISDAVTEATEISADVGDIQLSGELKGYNSLSCDVGEMYIETSLTELDYNYEIEVDMGEVTINGNDMRRSYSQNNGAANSFELEGSMGDVEVVFR